MQSLMYILNVQIFTSFVHTLKLLISMSSLQMFNVHAPIELSSMCLNVYLGVHLLIDDVVLALLPVSSLHGFGGGHHVLPHTLRGTSQSLALAHSHHMVEVLTDHSTPGIHLMGYHVPKIVTTNWDLLLIRITQIYQFIIHSLHFFYYL